MQRSSLSFRRLIGIVRGIVRRGLALIGALADSCSAGVFLSGEKLRGGWEGACEALRTHPRSTAEPPSPSSRPAGTFATFWPHFNTKLGLRQCQRFVELLVVRFRQETPPRSIRNGSNFAPAAMTADSTRVRAHPGQSRASRNRRHPRRRLFRQARPGAAQEEITSSISGRRNRAKIAAAEIPFFAHQPANFVPFVSLERGAHALRDDAKFFPDFAKRAGRHRCAA